MSLCTITEKLHIVPGTPADYKTLAHYHYRTTQPGPTAAIFSLKPIRSLPGLPPDRAIGVIVYTMPLPAIELRNIATKNAFKGLDRQTQMQWTNASIRSISRVIIEPRFRALGLAVRLVTETMPRMNVPIIEALAVMGAVNPFFQKAGMKAYHGPPPKRSVRLIEALELVGVEQSELVDPRTVHDKLEKLGPKKNAFIQREIRLFLQSYRGQRNKPPDFERTRFFLTRLTTRPIYYIWFNPEQNGPTTKINTSPTSAAH